MPLNRIITSIRRRAQSIVQDEESVPLQRVDPPLQSYINVGNLADLNLISQENVEESLQRAMQAHRDSLRAQLDVYTERTWVTFNGADTISGYTNGENTIVDNNDGLEEQLEMNDEIKIGSKTYSKDECVVIEGCWYLKSDLGILTDIFTGEQFHSSRCNSVIDSIEIIDGKAKTSSTLVSRMGVNYCQYVMSEKYRFEGHITDVNNIKGWDFIEDPVKNILVDSTTKVEKVKNVKQYIPFKNIASKNNLLKGKIGDKSQTYLITEGLQYTFGVEIEVNRGNIPMYTAARGLNISCVRDGSINGGEGGPEYVTGVLVGDNGITHLQKICNELSNRTTVDKSCGVHLHLGNIDFNKKFLINSYILACYLQKEIFETLPRSRRKNEYCRELPNLKFRVSTGNTIEDKIALEEDYNALFKFIAADKIEHPNFEYNKSRQHPSGPKCGYNHSTPRYCWINYVPAMFDTRGNKSYSIEIRNHSGTTNFVKIKNWLLFFMGFMAFVERHPEKIVKGITMRDIIDTVLPKKSKSLNFYFENRKKLFAEDSAEQTEYANSNTNEEFKNIKDLIIE